MNVLTKEEFNEIIKKYNNSLFVVCAGNGILKNRDCAGFIAISEEDAKKFFDSIVNDLPENMKNFSTVKMSNVRDIYSFCGLFNSNFFKYINIVNYGIIEKENFIKKDIENVNYIAQKLNGFNDNAKIYSVYTKNNEAFSPTEEFRQCFFSNPSEANQFIQQYNNEQLGLYISWIELVSIVYGKINDLLNCTFDGKNCSGWDIVEAAYITYNKNNLNDEDIKNILDNNKLYLLASANDSNNVMELYNNIIFFTSKEKAENFKEIRLKNMTPEFNSILITDISAYDKLISNSRYIYIDCEKHCNSINFLIGAGLRKKAKHWGSLDEVKAKAKELWNKEKLYIVLSYNNANTKNNSSVPYIVDSNPRCLWIFENYEEAKKFIDRNNKGKINDKYPIGVIDNSKLIWSLKTTLSIANALNIPDVEFNPEEYECIHFSIKELFEFNEETLSNDFSIISPNNDVENVNIRFNPFSF